MPLYKSLGQVAGSWPFVPTTVAPNTQLLPGTLLGRATILGFVKEPSGGYAVGSKTFSLQVDGSNYSVVFTAGNKTLQEVIDTINASTLAGPPSITRDVAYNDNGFLRLESPTSGPGRIQANHVSDYDVLFDLGLLAGVQVFGSELHAARHWDPDRQVALPEQLLLVDGEELSANAINRSLYQLSTNTDWHENLLDKKRVTKPAEVAPFVFTASGVDTGELVNATVLVDPTIALDKLFTILDADFMPLTVENEAISGTTGTGTVAWTAQSRVMAITGVGFLSTDPVNDVYVKVTSVIADQGQGENLLQNELLKITRFISGTQVEVLPIIPSTGVAPEDAVDWSISGTAAVERIVVTTDAVVVAAVKDVNNGTDVRLGPVARTGSGFGTPRAPTRVERGNRIVIDDVAVDFTVDSVVGDEVVWTGHDGPSIPFNNNLTFRIAAIIDEKTIEVTGTGPAPWGPASLNPDLTTPGTIVVQSDGKFWENPFIVFGSQVPPDGTTIVIAYNVLTNIKDATDDPLFLGAGAFGAKYAGAADTKVQEAVIAILGPSATDLSSYLHSDRRNNLEDLYYRTNREHHAHDAVDATIAGRHSDIRPDRIDMYPEISGSTVIVRGATAEVDVSKLEVRDAADNVRYLVMASGKVRFQDATPTASHKIEIDPNNHTISIQVDETTGGSASVSISTRDTGGVPSLGIVGAGDTGAKITMTAHGPPTINPLTYEWVVDTLEGGMILNILDDGAGGSGPVPAWIISPAGQVNLERTGAGTTLGLSDGTKTYTVVTATGSPGNISHLHTATDDSTVNFTGVSPSTGAGGDLSLLAGNGSAGLAGGTTRVSGGSRGAGTNVPGGSVELRGGTATGSNSSLIRLMAATAGASGTANRLTESYLECRGDTGQVRFFKELDVNNNNLLDVNFLDFDSVTTPPTQADGLLYYNGNRDQLEISDGTTFGRVPKLVHSLNARETETPAAATETAFATSVYTIPANTLRDGSVIRVTMQGEWDSNSIVRTLRLRLGSFTSDTTFSGALMMQYFSVNTTTQNFSVCEITIRGAPGATATNFAFSSHGTAAGAGTPEVVSGGPTVATNGPLDLFLTWESANISQPYDLDVYSVEIL